MLKKLIYQTFFWVFISIYAVCPLTVFAQHHPTHVLVYDKPAANWNEALPIGNGRLGGMVYGGVVKEEIQLNEETIWAGGPGNNVPKDTYDDIEAIRTLLDKGEFAQAQELSNETFPRSVPEGLDYGMPYQTFGSLWLTFPEAKTSEYKRTLDIDQAVSHVSYKQNGVFYKREVFTSFTDDVMIVRLTADKGASINVGVGLSSPHKSAGVSTESGNLKMTGTGSSVDSKIGEVDFEGIVRPVVEGGKVIWSAEKFEIVDADQVTLYVSIATNFKNYNDLSVNPAAKVREIMGAAIKNDYRQALKNHVKFYRNYFDRVSLDLGTSEQSKKYTDERVKTFASSYDPELVSLYFQFGRYLLICSSQPGGQPANLQGIWNDKLSPPWDSKYTVNINTEMNYWPAEVTNLSEMHEPLFSMLAELAVTGKQSASEMYKARGWNMHHNTDLWRITGIVDGGYYGMWPMGGAWLTQHLWQHYLYSGDKEFLKSYYDVLKGKALFYLDVLQKVPEKDWLVVSPSISPENSYMTGSVGISAGTTMDNQLVFDVFQNFIHASEILDKEKSLRDSVRLALSALPPMQIGKHTQLQEWLIDMDKTTDKHRHISHLYGLYPSGQISPFRNPELIEAARNSLIYRGDKSTGWSMGWKVNWWARMLDGNQAYKLIQDQLSPPEGSKGQGGGTYPNLLDAHPPFQIDGNFGCTSGIAEMLLQSYDGEIYVLPALPTAFTSGKVSGLRARGGFEVDISWEKGQVTMLKITSNVGGNCRLRLAKGVIFQEGETLKPAVGDNPNPLFHVNQVKKPLISAEANIRGLKLPETELFDLQTEKGKHYIFHREK